MNVYNHILAQREKIIIANMVMNINNNNSKKEFKELSARIIRKYTGKPFFVGNKWKNEIKDYSINLIWNKDTGETVFMHFFANHNCFNLIEQFKDLNSDVNAIDNNGATALIYLAKNPYLYNNCAEIIKDKRNIDVSVKDKYGKSFHIYFFEKYTEEELSYRYNNEDLKKFAFLGKVSLFKTILLDWLNPNILKDKENLLFVSEKCLMLINNMNYDQKFPNPKELKDIEIIASNLQLEATMPVNKNTDKKFKI